MEESSDRDGVRLILGLGNPGERYRQTRHNLGFRVLDQLAESWQLATRRLECNAQVAEGEGAILAWPQTYMNRSGYAARCLSERHGFEAYDILVVYDDTALPLSTLRLRSRGGPGGHRGMESVIRNLQTDEIARLRLGIGPEDGFPAGEDLTDFVLSPFASDELEAVEDMIRRAVAACECWLAEGSQATMSRFNG
jgi:PTH1 family peptidyl-tRNA hydrolase